MINHARTLLLNRQSDYFDDVTGAAYIPSEFYPLLLTPTLQSIYGLLIPTGLIPEAEAQVGNMLMQLLHTPELESTTLGLDSRITYPTSGWSVSNFALSPVQVTAHQSGGSDVVARYDVLGAPNTSLADSGTHVWKIRYVDFQTVEVQHDRGITYQVTIAPTSAPVSLPVTLVPDYLTAYFELPSGSLTATFVAEYTVVLPTPYKVGDVLSSVERAALSAPAVHTIFNSDDTDEVYANMKEIWLADNEGSIRLGAFILAYLYRLEGHRQV